MRDISLLLESLYKFVLSLPMKTNYEILTPAADMLEKESKNLIAYLKDEFNTLTNDDEDYDIALDLVLDNDNISIPIKKMEDTTNALIKHYKRVTNLIAIYPKKEAEILSNYKRSLKLYMSYISDKIDGIKDLLRWTIKAVNRKQQKKADTSYSFIGVLNHFSDDASGQLSKIIKSTEWLRKLRLEVDTKNIFKSSEEKVSTYANVMREALDYVNENFKIEKRRGLPKVIVPNYLRSFPSTRPRWESYEDYKKNILGVLGDNEDSRKYLSSISYLHDLIYQSILPPPNSDSKETPYTHVSYFMRQKGINLKKGRFTWLLRSYVNMVTGLYILIATIKSDRIVKEYAKNHIKNGMPRILAQITAIKNKMQRFVDIHQNL